MELLQPTKVFECAFVLPLQLELQRVEILLLNIEDIR